MNITTTFTPGDKAWVFRGRHAVQLTIGLVRPCVIDSPGARGWLIMGEVLQYSGDCDEPDNYRAQSSYTEEYMCVETGIGSGSVYTLGETIFATEAECLAANAERIAEQERRAAEAAAWKRKQLLAEEESARRKLAAIEAAKRELRA